MEPNGHWDKRIATAKTVRAARLLAAMGVFIALGFCVLCGLVLLNERRDVWAATSKEAMNLALATARDVARNFEIYDLTLQAVVQELQHPDIVSLPADLRRRVLFDRSSTAHYYGPVLVLDAAGAMTITSGPAFAEFDNYAEKEFFRAHLGRNDVGLYISHPFRSRIDGKWKLALSRRLANADGTFAGIVLGTINRDCFETVFHNIELGPHGAIAVLLADGYLVDRQPAADAAIDTDLSHGTMFAHYSAARSGLVNLRSDLDGVERLSAFTHVGDLPLVLTVSYAVVDIYASWWNKTLPVGSCVLLLCGATIAFAFQLWREFRRRHAAEAELAIIARTDVLTKLDNRRSFDEALDREWRRAVRNGSPLSLCLIDIDFFKAYNDQYGHQAGDEVLTMVAMTIAQGLDRPADLGARYGGEEFAVLLPETPGVGAQIVAEHIRTAVQKLDMPHLASPLEILTVSIGLESILPRPDWHPAQLVKAADMALYKAKELGRNRVEFARESGLTPPLGIVDEACAA